jgi:hypothetical protein
MIAEWAVRFDMMNDWMHSLVRFPFEIQLPMDQVLILVLNDD